ncbi:hypothetical protein GGR54DRAFT_643295 [Hypoxylon sp. NC1633]|nr:hypothetical protein GGR54DRAFT_643295 [Hypoxylon sp. NC1633]
MNFTDLPYELRWLILEALADDCRITRGTSDDGLARYVTVCKEWQTILEPEIFRQLIISASCLEYLDMIVGRNSNRRRLVKHIWLRVEFPGYPCGSCVFEESDERIKRNNRAVTRAIYHLFAILSHWESSGPSSPRDGITLELSIHSLSDSKHHFQNHNFSAFHYSEEDDFSENPLAVRLSPRRYDGFHQWESFGSPEHALSFDPFHMNLLSRLRVHGQPISLGEAPPTVEIVRRFLVRRQFYRELGPHALRRIFRALPRLEHIHLECWRSVTHELEFKKNHDREAIFRPYVPPALRRLCWYDDDDSYYELLGTEARQDSPRLAAILVKVSRQLESLAVSFVIDARDFFRSFYPGRVHISEKKYPEFPRLESIALTSNELSPSESSENINNLLHAAGNAAARMPSIRTMELWNGQPGEAAIFCCNRTADAVTISWLTTWDIPLEPRVITAWKNVGIQHRLYSLIVETDRIPPPPICPGSILRHLRLQRQVLHPISLYQIQREADEAADAQAWAAAYEI